ncbi:unnamed protein product [Ectocarpus sp. CCAP 1310/34]|nr:unnamed protein product [Ectocarpus sp. CCAP 1310/34]
METGLGDVYEEPSAVDDSEPSQASNGRDSGIAPGGLAALMDRVDAQLSVNQSFPDVDPNIYGGKGMGGGGPVSSDDVHDGGEEQYGGVESNTEQRRQHLEPPIESDSRSSAEAMRRLENLHTHAPSYAASSTMEGGPENLGHSTNAEESDFYPFRTKEQQLILIWQHTHQISQKALGGLLDILLLEDEGNGFDVRGLERVNAAHFNNRMRQYLPLLRVLERNVPSTQQGKSSAVVYDVPVNLLLARDMKLVSETALSETYPAGNFARRGSRRQLRLWEKVYVHDKCICEIAGTPSACRLLELFWDTASGGVVATVEGFRPVAEVRIVGQAEMRGRLVRVWEDCTAGAETQHNVAGVLGLAEIYTADEMEAGKHDGEWHQGVRCTLWDRFLGEGFVVQARAKRRRSEEDSTQKYEVTHAPWCKEGTSDDPLFVLRRKGFHLNNDILVFRTLSLATTTPSTALAWETRHTRGTYFGWPWRSQAVQRLRRQMHVGTLAGTGATCQGEIGLQCEILGLLQRGRLGECMLMDDDGAISKHEDDQACNNFSRFPCPYCMVEQRDNITGGDLGDAQYDIEANRRTWGHGRSRQSMVLGLITDTNGPSLPMHDSMLTAPAAVVPVERLHFDALGSCQLCQVSCLEMLSTQGRRLVSAVVAQNLSLLYPAGTERLKDIVSNYSSLTGSD